MTKNWNFLSSNISNNQAITTFSSSLTGVSVELYHANHVLEPLTSSIFIKNIVNVSALKNITSPNYFTCRNLSSYFIVHPLGHLNYNSIINYIYKTDTSFHSLPPPPVAFILNRIVIRNLHYSTLNTDIINAALAK